MSSINDELVKITIKEDGDEEANVDDITPEDDSGAGDLDEQPNDDPDSSDSGEIPEENTDDPADTTDGETPAEDASSETRLLADTEDDASATPDPDEEDG